MKSLRDLLRVLTCAPWSILIRVGTGDGRCGRATWAVALSIVAVIGCVGDPPGPTAEQQAKVAQYVSDAAPAIEGLTAVDVDLDGKVHLVGYAVTPKQAQYPPGTQVKVTLLWRCDSALGDGWQLFTHLLGATGDKLDNLDGAGPLRSMEGVTGQPLPPARWQPKKFYRDELSFVVPPEPGPAMVVAAGIYKESTRLPIRGAGGDRENRTAVVRLATGAKDPRATIKELEARRLPPKTVISIDGKLDEPAWAAAATTGNFVEVGTGRDNPALPLGGSARLVWDDEALYVAIEARDRTVRGGWPAGAKDPHLWEKDTVEIMIDPDGDGDNKDYYEIQINPQNLVFDTQYDGYNSPNGGGKGPFGHKEWSARLTSAVLVDGTLDDDGDQDRGYTVEAKLPWASFDKAKQAPPKVGDSWRINFYAMQDNGGVAWSPILGQGNFHRASRFGRVRWADGAPGSPKP